MQIVVYTKDNCPYCTSAKRLLDEKKVLFEEIDITNNDELKNEMLGKSNGMKTVPQIFIKDKHIGGYSELKQLNTSGKLDDMLSEL